MSEKLANAAPLGLLGFGLTTVLLNLINIVLFPLDSMILAMGLVYGGIAQVIVGIMEYRRGNTFGTTTFTSYGLFCAVPRDTHCATQHSSLHRNQNPHGNRHGSVLHYVGHLQFCNVLWDIQSQPSTAIRLHKRDRAVLPPRGKRPYGKRSITWKF